MLPINPYRTLLLQTETLSRAASRPQAFVSTPPAPRPPPPLPQTLSPAASVLHLQKPKQMALQGDPGLRSRFCGSL